MGHQKNRPKTFTLPVTPMRLAHNIATCVMLFQYLATHDLKMDLADVTADPASFQLYIRWLPGIEGCGSCGNTFIRAGVVRFGPSEGTVVEEKDMTIAQAPDGRWHFTCPICNEIQYLPSIEAILQVKEMGVVALTQIRTTDDSLRQIVENSWKEVIHYIDEQNKALQDLIKRSR